MPKRKTNGNAQTADAFLARQRSQWTKKRQALLAAQKKISEELAAVDRELGAIDAYHSVRSGKRIAAPQPRVSRSTQKRATKRAKRAGTRRPRGSVQGGVLKIIAPAKEGLTRGDIIGALGSKGNRSVEQSVSNALSAMLKSKKIARKDGKYLAA
jgi:hypothetical protein